MFVTQIAHLAMLLSLLTSSILEVSNSIATLGTAVRVVPALHTSCAIDLATAAVRLAGLLGYTLTYSTDEVWWRFFYKVVVLLIVDLYSFINLHH